jgi:hypothetical protein
MKSDHPFALSPIVRREALVEWMSRPEYTHAITLMPNRGDISFDLLRRMFGRFCREVDQYMLGVRNVQMHYSVERLNMIMLPEKLDVNPHLHGVADFSRCFWQFRLDKPWEDELPAIWKGCTRSAGEMKIERRKGAGFGWYSTKEALRRDHDFCHSWDFHPNTRLADEQLKAVLESIAPSRKRKAAARS